MIPQLFSFLDNPVYTFIALMLFSVKVVIDDRRRWGLSFLPSNFLMLAASGLFLYEWPRHGLSLKWTDSFVLASTATFGLAYAMRRWERDTLRYLDEYGPEETSPIVPKHDSLKRPISIIASDDSTLEATANREVVAPVDTSASWTIVSGIQEQPDGDSVPVSTSSTPRKRAFHAS